jgi:EpsI family protein
MFALAALLGLMWVLNKIGPQKALVARETLKVQQIQEQPPGSSPWRSSPRPALSPKSEGDSEAKSTPSGLLHPPQFPVAVALLGLSAAFSYGVEFRERIPVKRPLAEFPLEIGQWAGATQTMEQEFVQALDLSDYAIVDYRNPDGQVVNFYVAYYETQRKGESIHSPETCLPGGGWAFREAGSAAIPVPGHEKGTFRVKRAVMEKLGERELAYFWFAQRGRVVTNAYALKFWVFWDALTKQRTDGALVRAITPVYGTENLEAAEARLQDFVRRAVPVLEGFLPGREAVPSP